MTLADRPVYLLDVNVLLALLDVLHVHHDLVESWFETPDLQWTVCAFTEAGVLRFFTRPYTGGLSMGQAVAMLERLKQRPGQHYQSIAADWHTLTRPFAKRIQGHNQVTDAYLLGVAIREGLVLATLDGKILHMAGEYEDHVLLLEQRGI